MQNLKVVSGRGTWSMVNAPSSPMSHWSISTASAALMYRGIVDDEPVNADLIELRRLYAIVVRCPWRGAEVSLTGRHERCLLDLGTLFLSLLR